MTMLSRINIVQPHYELLVNLEITRKVTFVLFQVSALNHYTNLYLRVDIYRRGIENFLKILNAYSSTSWCSKLWHTSL